MMDESTFAGRQASRSMLERRNMAVLRSMSNGQIGADSHMPIHAK
jgi:hypothetical protein